MAEALGNEYRHGIAMICSGETAQGARRLAAGTGRHGPLLTPTTVC